MHALLSVYVDLSPLSLPWWIAAGLVLAVGGAIAYLVEIAEEE